MIQITDRTKCCGCTACYSICPSKCISMMADEEGFLYPVTDDARCVECGACERVCPYNNLHAEEKTESLYAAIQSKNEKERSTSTAGGAFSLFANYIIENGGVVYAVGYDNRMVVCHKACNRINDLRELRGSKYVQSTLRETYSEIKRDLKKKTVLFVGTPCQVHGLKNYIGDPKNLYTTDLLCLGVSSPKLFEEWITYLEKKYRAKVIYVAFRDKHYGYSTPNVKVFFENEKEMDQKYDTCVHANLFFRHYNVRPSCYECEFRERPRASDFTIGDFTEIADIDKSMNDDKGTTKLWVHTEKGKVLLARVKDGARMHYIAYNTTNIVGGPRKQIKRPERRDEFFRDAKKMDYFSLVSKWEPISFKGQIARMMRPVINRFPFKTLIFQHLRRGKMRQYQRNLKELNAKNSCQ